MLAPLLLAIPAGALYALLGMVHRPAWPSRVRLGVAIAITALGVLALWLPARLQFSRVCDRIGPPRVIERMPVDGFFLDDSTANSFGTRYLHEEGFAWYEARSIYRRDAYTRYRKTDVGIQTDEIDALSAVVRVASESTAADTDIAIQRVVITHLPSGRELASAAQARFGGGPAKWVLGAYGSANCPNLMSSGGGEWFQRYYHLARDTLR